MVTLDRHDGGFDTFGDQSDILCIPNKIEERNESKSLVQHIPYDCRCRQDGKKQSKENSEQKWNNNVNIKTYWNKMCVKKINNENPSMPAC